MPKVWDYGDAGDRWPVQVGDVWEVGPHVLACGDLERGAAVELLAHYGPPNLVYADPPWDPGNAASFRTKAGVPRKVDFDALLRRVVDAARGGLGSVFLEMGRRRADHLREIVASTGGIELGQWPITYYRKHPCLLFQFGWRPGLVQATSPFSGHDDDDTPALAIAECSREGDLVFDTCTGRGLTCRTSHMLGRRFLGLELHPRRLAVAIDWLAEHGLKPVKRGQLHTMTGEEK